MDAAFSHASCFALPLPGGHESEFVAFLAFSLRRFSNIVQIFCLCGSFSSAVSLRPCGRLPGAFLPGGSQTKAAQPPLC